MRIGAWFAESYRRRASESCHWGTRRMFRKNLWVMGCLLWVASMGVQAMPVLVDGKLWEQPEDFLSLSWDAISAVCDPNTGACNGTLNGKNVTGKTWASTAQVGSLFEAVGIPNFTDSDPNYVLLGFDSPLAPLIFEAGFSATFEDLSQRYVAGWTRSLGPSGSNQAYEATWVDGLSSGGTPDNVGTDWLYFTGQSTDRRGAWLFSPPAPVPAPPAAALLALGLVALRFSRSQRKSGNQG
jgi:hypothetical protein